VAFVENWKLLPGQKKSSQKRWMEALGLDHNTDLSHRRLLILGDCCCECVCWSAVDAAGSPSPPAAALLVAQTAPVVFVLLLARRQKEFFVPRTKNAALVLLVVP